MAIKTNSLVISETGVTLTNAYSRIDSIVIRKSPPHGNTNVFTADVSVLHYANSSSRASNKEPAKYHNIHLDNCNALTGSLASGSVSYIYDQIKLVSPFSGSTISDV